MKSNLSNSPQNLKPVITQNGDMQIISHPGQFDDKVKDDSDQANDADIIANAEAALEELSSEFDTWLSEEVENLIAAHKAALSSGLEGKVAETLFLCAHDLRGQAATFGCPLIGQYCASLCRIFDAVSDKSKIPMHAVQSHIDAVIAARHRKIKDTEDKTANEVLKRLQAQSDQFCALYDAHQDAHLT